MRLVLAAVVVTVALAQPAGDCVPGSLGNYDVTTRWNKAANDGNAYVTMKQAGKIDYKLRAQFEREMKAVFKCECW